MEFRHGTLTLREQREALAKRADPDRAWRLELANDIRSRIGRGCVGVALTDNEARQFVELLLRE